MSDLLKLDNIRKRNGDIKAFPLNTNLKNGRTLKDGWGEITVAIDNPTVLSLLADKEIGIVYITTREEWEKEKAGQ